MRTFIAVELTPELKAGLQELVRRLKGKGGDVKWVGAHGLHLTLKFLGEISPEEARTVETVLRDVAGRHAAFPVEVKGTGVFDLTKFGVTGCRPDFSGDGKKVTWGATDCDLCIGDIDFAGAPRVTNVRRVGKCQKEYEVYHSNFSPDGRYIAFSHGPTGEEQVGCKAPGWDICIADIGGAAGTQPPKWVEITTDGNHNKEPDWVPQR